MSELTQMLAKQIIDRVGGPGEPPEYGFQYFTAGLDLYLSVIDEEYFSTFIRQGGSSFKLVVGVFGGGKTHFLLNVRDLAWKYNFITANVDLSPTETPFSKLEQVYKDIVKNMVPSLQAEEILGEYDRGFEAFIRRWYVQKYRENEASGLAEEECKEELSRYLETLRGVESTSFLRAFRGAVKALMNENEEEFSLIGQWLKGEGYVPEHKKLNILQKIDKTTAFEMIRSLGQLMRQLGYSGLIISFDEAEQQSSMSTKERTALMSNLRQVIDECAKNTFQGVMIFYAVPDVTFLQGRMQEYEALNQRLKSEFDEINPTGVKIELDRVIPEPEPFLKEVGRKLADVFQIAYNYQFENKQDLEVLIQSIVTIAVKEKFADIGYKRVFVQKFIGALFNYQKKGILPKETELE